MPATLLETRAGQYSIVDVALPSRPVEPAGVILWECETGQADVRLRRDWRYIAPPEDAEVLELIEEDLREQIRQQGPEQLFRWLEDTLSNVLRISERQPVLVDQFERTLNRLYNRYVPSTVLKFLTHLPVYSCKAAAGRFGDQMPVEEEGWVEAPPGLRLTQDMFVAQVVGRSMEPAIPDGARCVFRAGVAGSRQGKWLLIENFAESEAGGQRYTVKRYRSEKVYAPDGTWQHSRIILEPLNPEYEPWEIEEGHQCRVIAEFVCVLD